MELSGGGLNLALALVSCIGRIRVRRLCVRRTARQRSRGYSLRYDCASWPGGREQAAGNLIDRRGLWNCVCQFTWRILGNKYVSEGIQKFQAKRFLPTFLYTIICSSCTTCSTSLFCLISIYPASHSRVACFIGFMHCHAGRLLGEVRAIPIPTYR